MGKEARAELLWREEQARWQYLKSGEHGLP
jgi:hypothetical protein